MDLNSNDVRARKADLLTTILCFSLYCTYSTGVSQNIRKSRVLDLFIFFFSFINANYFILYIHNLVGAHFALITASNVLWHAGDALLKPWLL